MKIKIKEVDGIEIRIDEDSGKFSAMIDGKEATRAKLSDMEKLISSQRNSLTVYHVDTWYSNRSIIKREIIGFDTDGKAISKHGKKEGYGPYYVLTDDQKAKFESMIAQQEKLNKDWQILVDKLTRVNYRNFDHILTKKTDAKK